MPPLLRGAITSVHSTTGLFIAIKACRACNESNLPQDVKERHTYLLALFSLACCFVISSKARTGLQNSCPLFLIIFCFMAVRLFHSRTSLKIWQNRSNEEVTCTFLSKSLLTWENWCLTASLKQAEPYSLSFSNLILLSCYKLPMASSIQSP